MRRRITRALLAASAAGVTLTTLGFAAAGSAGAAVHGGRFAPSGGPPEFTNCGTGTLANPLTCEAGYGEPGAISGIPRP
jgi:hypothetical protein